MPLTPGSRLGVYEVKDKLGEGGMGEVYRAHDTKLGRDVALKILSASFATDAERVARFEREARTLASLNQPLIAQIYGFEQSDGISALVMELVEGEDLAARIKRGALPLDEAIPIARQIAEALEAAHEAGIVHRDLKPANIKLRPDGTVKILDFGLAKAFDPVTASGVQPPPQVTQSPTITTPAMTMRGVILGTAAYMAPEQAKGRPVTKRADIWAFGCVLFEMLSGQRPFDGDDMSEVLASVIKTDPDWSLLPRDVPPAMRRLMRSCLEKDPRQRVGDAAVVRYALDRMLDESIAAPIVQPARRLPTRIILGVVAVAVIVAIAVGATLALNRSRVLPYRFAIVPSADLPFVAQGSDRDIAVTPDGRTVVYRTIIKTVPMLVVRGVDETIGRVLDGTNGGRGPIISPDGQWVAFNAEGRLKKISLSGGSPVTVCEMSGALRGGSWQGDHIVFATARPDTGLFRVAAAGGTPESLTTPDSGAGELDHVSPVLSPDGAFVFFTSLGANSSLRVLNLATRQVRSLVPGATQAAYLDSGILVFVVGSTLRAARFDLAGATLTSEPVPVVENISSAASGAANYAVSKDGLLLYVQGEGSIVVQRSLVWVSRDGREEPVKTGAREFADPRLSPDGRLAAVEINDAPDDVWTLDLGRGAVTRQSFENGEDETALWLADGRSIAYSSTRGGVSRSVFVRRADGVGAEQSIWSGRQHVHVEDVDAVANALLVSIADLNGMPMDIMRLPLDGNHKIESLIHSPFSEFGARLSPDGRAMAYVSNESGRVEIYVRAYPSLEGKTQVSTTGGSQPVWSRNGNELYFISDEGMMAVPLRTAPGLSVGPPQKLFAVSYYTKGANHTSYDVARDGRFLMVKEVGGDASNGAAPRHLQVVLNWFEELTAKVR